MRNYNPKEVCIGEHGYCDKKPCRVYLQDEARKHHTHIIGASGTGKSKLMEYMIKQDIRNKKGVLLLDPHGELFDNVLAWAVKRGHASRLIIIDPNIKDYSVGLNYLEYDREQYNAAQHVENVIYELGRIREEDITKTSYIYRFMVRFLQLAAIHNLTFSDADLLLTEEHKDLKYALTELLKNDKQLYKKLLRTWKEYDSLPYKTRFENITQPIKNRLETVLMTPHMENIITQQETTVDFYQAMQTGKVVLVRLHKGLSRNEKKLLGTIIIDKIYQAAEKRKPDVERFFYVYIDEFANFVSERTAEALDQIRKRHVPFVLAHQHRGQIRTDDIVGERLLSSIDTNTKVKIAFRLSRKDAEHMVDEMFAGQINGDAIKHIQEVIAFFPQKTREETVAAGSSFSTSQIESISSSLGQVTGTSTGKVFVPGIGWLETGEVSQMITNSSTKSSFDSTSKGRSTSEAYSDVRIDIPWYDLIPFKQQVSTTFFTIEEVRERYIQMLQTQSERYFHLKVVGETDKAPINSKTPTVIRRKPLSSVLENAKLNAVKEHGTKVSEVHRLSDKREQWLFSLLKEKRVNIELEKDEDAFLQDDYHPPESTP